MTFDEILTKIRFMSSSEHDKGYRFESLIKNYLMTDPVYSDQFKEIYLWKNFPLREQFGKGNTDLGIDLVAITKTGNYCAIQCKCYKENTVLTSSDFDSFITFSNKYFNDKTTAQILFFEHLYFINTTKNDLNENIKAKLKNQRTQPR